MNCWFQSADFSTIDLELSNADEILAAFESHDWSRELRSRATLQEGGGEWCDPGFGVVPGDGRILHLCPQDDGSVTCHYYHSRSRRLLGLLPSRQEVVKTWLIPSMADTPAVVQRFLRGEHDWLDSQG